MNCTEFREHLHEFIDSRLSARQMKAAERHLSECRSCSCLYGDHRLIRSSLPHRNVMPEIASETVMARVRQRMHRPLFDPVRAWDRVYTYMRDYDKSLWWTRASAIPLTVLFFCLLLLHFAPVKLERFAFLAISASEDPFGSVPRVLNVQVVQNRRDLNELMDTAWRLPYEDSLSLVAEITPEGRAEIDSVLEYPKSFDLLDAVNMTLSRSHFSGAGRTGNPLVIYSFQKIDVYEN